MTYEPPEPVCRRPGCDVAAAVPGGFCTDHGLRYVRWRAQRDDLDAADRHDLDCPLDDDPRFAAALDVLHRYLTRGPFDPPLGFREGER